MTLEELTEAVRAIPALVEAVEKLTIEVRGLREQSTPPQVSREEPPPGCLSLREAQERRILMLRQAAYLLQMSEQTLRRLIHRNLIRRLKGIRHMRTPFEEIEAFKRRTI